MNKKNDYLYRLAGDITPRELHAWLNTLPDNEQKESVHTWQLAALADLEMAETVDIEDDWMKLSKAMKKGTDSDLHHLSTNRVAQRRKKITWIFSTVVSVIAVLVIISLIYWVKPTTLNAPEEMITSGILPDGSSYELNNGSTLSYYHGLPWKSRKVELEGEAYFDIAEDSRFFIIETFNASIQVLGTRLNVRAWSGGPAPETEVVLETGLALLTSKAGYKKAVFLSPGQVSRLGAFSEDPTTPVVADLSAALKWRAAGLSFNDAPLSDVLEALEIRFGIEIQSPSAALRDTISLRFPEVRSAEAVIADISSYMGYSYVPIPGGFQIVVDSTDR